MAAVGYHLGSSPCLSLYYSEQELVEFKRKGYYLRLLLAQCTLWDNVLTGRDPPTAEACCSERLRGGGNWRLVADFTPTDKKEKKLYIYIFILSMMSTPHPLYVYLY